MNMSAATHASPLFGALPLMALLLAGFALILWNRRDKASTEKKIAQIDQELDLIRNQILLVSTGELPNGSIVKTIGYIEAISDMEAASAWEYRLAEKDALLKLAQTALGKGANAVVGIRKFNAHYDQAGSKWCVSRVAYCGTAVYCYISCSCISPKSLLLTIVGFSNQVGFM